MKITFISGARPQFIKLAPIIMECKKNNIEIFHIHTGQHYDEELSNQIFLDLDIPKPNTNLDINKSRRIDQISQMLLKITDILEGNTTDAVMVIGDTNSTIAGALASGILKIPLIHLEAGMRSNDWDMPEEFNRIIVDRITSLFITSTLEGYNNLKNEGVDENKILLTGDINVDSIIYITKKEMKTIKISLPEKFILATIHRASNVDQKNNLLKIYDIFRHSKIPILLPLHPRTKKNLIKFGLFDNFNNLANITVIKPLGYYDFIKIMNKSVGLLTDSGGIQKEAFILKKPCITLRENTEWKETITMGANRLLGLNVSQVLDTIEEISNESFKVVTKHPYGNGQSAESIIRHIIALFKNEKLNFEDNIHRD